MWNSPLNKTLKYKIWKLWERERKLKIKRRKAYLCICVFFFLFLIKKILFLFQIWNKEEYLKNLFDAKRLNTDARAFQVFWSVQTGSDNSWKSCLQISHGFSWENQNQTATKITKNSHARCCCSCRVPVFLLRKFVF